jgi:N-glycosidase YbiA
MKAITEFQGEYRFLSNFWPCHLASFGLVFPTVEHGYQAMKMASAIDRRTIAAAETPGQAKRLGRAYECRPGWFELRIPVMRTLVESKFYQHPLLGQKLLETGDAELVEGNSWGDTFWGVCDGKGSNHLGRILMETRSLLRLMED